MSYNNLFERNKLSVNYYNKSFDQHINYKTILSKQNEQKNNNKKKLVLLYIKIVHRTAKTVFIYLWFYTAIVYIQIKKTQVLC